MNSLFSALPDIIKNASTNTLSIFALLLVILAGLAFVFFRKSGEWIRGVVFLSFAAGAVLIGAAAIGSNSRTPEPKPPPPQQKEASGNRKPSPNPPSEPITPAKAPILHEVTVVLYNSSEAPNLSIDKQPARVTRYSSGVAALRVSDGYHEIEAEYPNYVCKALFTAPTPDRILARCEPR